MNALLNKRGLELAIGTVAVLAIVLIVVLVVVGFFLGGFGRAGGGIIEVGKQGENASGELQLGFKCFATSRGDSNTCSQIDNATDCNAEKNCYWGFGQ